MFILETYSSTRVHRKIIKKAKYWKIYFFNMNEDGETYIINKNGNEVIIEGIPEEYINNGHKLIIRLKENYIEYDYLFIKMINIEDEKYTFKVGYFGYYECEIFDSKNILVYQERETFVGQVRITLNTNTSHGTIRSYFQLNDEEFQENTMVLVNKMEKTYFEHQS